MDGRVKPCHDLGKKLANVFKASSASGNIRVLKFRDDDTQGLNRIVTPESA